MFDLLDMFLLEQIREGLLSLSAHMAPPLLWHFHPLSSPPSPSPFLFFSFIFFSLPIQPPPPKKIIKNHITQIFQRVYIFLFSRILILLIWTMMMIKGEDKKWTPGGKSWSWLITNDASRDVCTFSKRRQIIKCILCILLVHIYFPSKRTMYSIFRCGNLPHW